MMRLLRSPHSGIFLRSFRLHSAHYARETIAKICSLWVALATAIISQTGSGYTQRSAMLSGSSKSQLIAASGCSVCHWALCQTALAIPAVGSSLA